MIDFISSSPALKVYSSFFANLAAAWFLGILASVTLLELTQRLIFVTISLYLAIFFERRSR
ncbi:MAG: hypothetical protein A2868_03295 [Candidatus Levybacteria bacterium RIFCSPHIGHO2_01_FULL_40_15b]|nr:MAG: hypothetical protein A2868_03295 [Candidatus Levybacteria bacterium RIFCSPHIGHO2_01_FULL_40_15b]